MLCVGMPVVRKPERGALGLSDWGNLINMQ